MNFGIGAGRDRILLRWRRRSRRVDSSAQLRTTGTVAHMTWAAYGPGARTWNVVCEGAPWAFTS